jgi:hypothetical protein
MMLSLIPRHGSLPEWLDGLARPRVELFHFTADGRDPDLVERSMQALVREHWHLLDAPITASVFGVARLASSPADSVALLLLSDQLVYLQRQLVEHFHAKFSVAVRLRRYMPMLVVTDGLPHDVPISLPRVDARLTLDRLRLTDATSGATVREWRLAPAAPSTPGALPPLV